MIIAIGLLFVICSAIGGFLLKLYKGYSSEAILMSLGFGLCTFPIFGIILSFFNLLDARVVAVIGLILLIMHTTYKKFRLRLDLQISVVLVCSLLMFGVYMYGGLNQMWLEDGDPNGYAVAASYIVHYKTFLKPNDLFVARYMEPYPVGFSIWNGILSQFDYNVPFHMMWFNYFVISASYVFLYFLTYSIFKCKWRAMAAALLLMALPTFSTRFIFAQSFALAQIILALYFISKSFEDKRFVFPSGLVIGSLLLTHPMSSVIMAVFMFIWLVIEYIYEKRISSEILKSGILGMVVAAPWWVYEFFKYGTDKILFQLNLLRLGETAFGLTDPTLKLYSIGDFISVPLGNTIDNMTGIGAGMFVLLVLAIYGVCVGKDKNRVLFTAMTLFCIIGIFSNWLPISFIPTRMWVFMSIPLAIILAQPFVVSFFSNDLSRAIILIIVGVILITSLYPKVYVNTQRWGNSRFNSMEEYDMLMFLKTLPLNSKIMDACMYERVWGLGHWDDPLDRAALIFRNGAVNTSAYGWDSEGWLNVKYPENSFVFGDDINETYNFLKYKNYEYLIIGNKCLKHGMIFYDEYKEKVNMFVESDDFEKVLDNGVEYVFKLK